MTVRDQSVRLVRLGVARAHWAGACPNAASLDARESSAHNSPALWGRDARPRGSPRARGRARRREAGPARECGGRFCDGGIACLGMHAAIPRTCARARREALEQTRASEKTSVHGPMSPSSRVELLGGGVARRAHHEVAARGRQRDSDRLVEHLGQTEVEHLETVHAGPRDGEEQVGRLDVAVHHARGGARRRARARPARAGRWPRAGSVPASRACAGRAGRRRAGRPSSHSSTMYGTIRAGHGEVVVALVMQRTMSRLP